MITKLALVLAATHQGIFALPTKHGERGMVLLASLNINMRSTAECVNLLSLFHANEIELTRRDTNRIDILAIDKSLRSRGIPPWLLHEGSLDDKGHAWYFAFSATAHTTTVDTLRDKHLHLMCEWLGTRTDVAARYLRDACAITRGDRFTVTKDEQQIAREICAEAWNRYAGIVS